MRALLGSAAREQTLEVRSVSGQGEVTVSGASPGFQPAALTAEGGVLLSGEGSFSSPCTAVFVGEEGVFRSSGGFETYKSDKMYDYYFDATDLGETGKLLLRFTLGAPCAGTVSVIYDNASGHVVFPAGSRAGDVRTLLLPLGTDGISGNLVWIECSAEMNFRLTACRSGESEGKRLTLLALDGEGAVYASLDGEVTAPLRAIPDGAADLLDFCSGEIVRRVGELALTADMLTETVAGSVGGAAPCFLLAGIKGRDGMGACLFTHGSFRRGSAAWASGAAGGLYADGDRLYLAIPYEELGASGGRDAAELLEAARGWALKSDAKIWYALDETHETREAFVPEGRLRMPHGEMTVRLPGEAKPRLITLRVYYRKET